MKRIKLSTFGQIVARVMVTLPEAFLPFLDNVVVDVELKPSRQDMLDAGLTAEEIDDGEVIYGLFDPLPTTSIWGDTAIDAHDVMHRLVVYKRPLEDDFPDRKQFLIEIRKTVIHELAHHFGWTDRDLERFDDTDDPFGDDFFADFDLDRLGDGDPSSETKE